MIHLEVAYRLLDKYKWISNYGDFIVGYCIHILTDWLNDLKIWRPFRNENMKNDNIEEIYYIYDIERQKKHVLSEQYKGKENCDISQYHYCTKDIIVSFIDECVNILSELLIV